MFPVCDYRQGMAWILNLLTQLKDTRNYSATAISTLYKSVLRTLSLPQPTVFSTAVT